jgi:hypothetical protein
MSKVSRSSFIALCAMLAACADSVTTPTSIAPTTQAAFNESSADLIYGYAFDEPFAVAFEAEAQSALMAAAAPQAATGSHASGHVGFNSGLPAVGLASEQYSFVALGTSASTPFAAKGHYELNLTTVTGRQNKVHGDVICMATVGNTTRVAGIITKIWVNNVQIPIPTPGPTHNYWVVIDNGEGQGTVDIASPMAYTIAPGAAAHCSTGLPSNVFSIQEGQIQVRP